MVAEVSAARQAIRAQPDSAASYLSLGVALKAAGEQESALRAFQKALDCDPRLAEAWFQKGLVEADLQKWSPAAGDFRRAVEVSSNHIDARLELGEMLLRLGDFEQAGGELDTVLRLDPRNAATTPDLAGTLRMSRRIIAGGRN